MSGDPTIGSLFTGAAGLDMGVQATVGGTVAWHSEIDSAACKVLAYRYPDVPNIGDVSTVDWTQVEPVDVIVAGYPCQPFSIAGKGKAEDDPRYLWPEVARAIRAMGPHLVVLENVRGHLVRGFSRVVGDLSSLGYDAQWTTVRASEIGAPHRRERLFCVAWPAAETPDVGHERPRATRRGRTRLTHSSRRVTANSDEQRLQGRDEDAKTTGTAQRPVGRSGRGITPADTDCNALWEQPVVARGCGCAAWGQYAPAIHRWEVRLGRSAPEPTELAPRGGRRLSPAAVEFMMGWPEGWVTDVPGISRNAQLKICGNGVVPQQAVEALRRLL